MHDPLVRCYLLATAFHIPPAAQDEMSAVQIDELLVLHSRITQAAAEQG
jgi:hypothetical protein